MSNGYITSFLMILDITVKSAYNEPAYKELQIIRNKFAFPNLFQGTSSLYVYKELRLLGTYFHGPDEFFISGFYCIL